MRLILVRHPAPAIAPGICYGSSDIAVAPEDHARVLATLIATLPTGLPIFSSPLQRCATLATALKDALGAPALHFDERLVEIDFGAWELQPWSAIARTDIDAWAADPVHYRPGGGESVAAMAERIRAFQDEMRMDAIVVCHAGAMRLMAAFHSGLDAVHAARTPNAIAYGGVLTLDAQV